MFHFKHFLSVLFRMFHSKHFNVFLRRKVVLIDDGMYICFDAELWSCAFLLMRSCAFWSLFFLFCLGKDEQPELATGEQLTEEDPEYELINRCNVLAREIDDEIMNVHRFVKDIFSKRFPELESIVVTPLEYMQVVQRAGSAKDLAQVPLL